jgi:membrane protein DedA with SNARE-associated domain
MAEGIIAAVTAFAIGVISAGGYLGIVLLMAIESACIPLPSEVIMPFAGYLVSTGRLELWLVATAGALGCNLGSTLAYAVARHGGRRAVERWGHWLLFGPRELERVDRFFARWGGGAVLVGRLLPVVRTFIAFPAGLAGMKQLRFQLYTFVGSWPWCWALAWIGMRLGERWNSDPRLRDWFHRADAAILVLVLLGVAWFVWSHLRQRRARRG